MKFEFHQWLHYNVCKGCVFYILSQHSENKSNLIAGRRKKSFFLVSSGLIVGRRRKKNLKNTKIHKTSLTYETEMTQYVDIDQMTDQNIKTEHELNHNCLMVVIENLWYLGIYFCKNMIIWSQTFTRYYSYDIKISQN